MGAGGWVGGVWEVGSGAAGRVWGSKGGCHGPHITPHRLHTPLPLLLLTLTRPLPPPAGGVAEDLGAALAAGCGSYFRDDDKLYLRACALLQRAEAAPAAGERSCRCCRCCCTAPPLLLHCESVLEHVRACLCVAAASCRPSAALLPPALPIPHCRLTPLLLAALYCPAPCPPPLSPHLPTQPTARRWWARRWG